MTIHGMRSSDRVLRGAQLLCIGSIAILTIAGANGYNGVVLGGVLLSICFLAGIAAFVRAFPELSLQQRDLFRWITAGAALGAVAKISWTLHFISNGIRPPFPALADYLLLGAELAVVAGFLRLLYTSRAGVKLEAFADLILIAVAVGVIMLPLGTLHFASALGGLDTEGKVVGGLSILAAATSLVLLALLITWRGEELSRRAMLGVAVGTVSTAVFTAWAAQRALSGSRPLHTPMDVLACAAILGFVSALEIRHALPTLELKIAERTAALSGTVEELKGVITEERAMRAANVIKDLRAFARRSASESRAVDLNEIIGRTVRLRSYQVDSGDVRVRTELDPNLPMVTGDPQQLQQVVVNLMSNALGSMKGEGELLIATCAQRDTESKRVLVEFTDTGPGIPEELRDSIFDPFLARQGIGEGVGMGLSVSYGIVAAHGGSLRLADGSSGRTKFVVELPAARWQLEGGSAHAPDPNRSAARVSRAAPTSS